MSNFNDKFDACYNTRQDYGLYKGYYDPTDDLPNGIHASIIRPEPTHPCELEEEEDLETQDVTETTSLMNELGEVMEF